MTDFQPQPGPTLEALHALARGEGPGDGLLHTCRFEGLGSETYGVEAIVARCRISNRPITPDATTLVDRAHIAVFDANRAWFADVHDGNISRLWLLSDAVSEFVAPEPGISVPFDPDLKQTPGDVLLAVSDHPALATDALALVLALGRDVVATSPARRTRAFTVRAFGTAEAGAALFAVQRLNDDPEHAPGFAMAAARWGPTENQIVHDSAGIAAAAAAPWTPQVGG